ncbi:two-component sensor histidine kinase [Streptomyces gilvosporeus]|uniref:histidine kinase n=2 Tax=Streptomyces gilvosporeus TaxID=553510 RepID=A0A1V0TTG5_9ACTN|nr:two-component sensor histidine kinase [Streptomyces gilvosporeus]
MWAATTTAAVLRRALRPFAGRAWAADLALGGGLTVFDMVTLQARHPAPGLFGVLLWGAQTVPLFWRRRFPRTVLGAMTALFVLFEALDPVAGKTPGPYLLIFAVYALARYAALSASLPGAVLSLLAAVATDLVGGRSGPPQLGSLEPITATTFVAFYGVAWLLGHGRRRIDTQARRLRDLNDRLRAEQEINARQAVVAERARIARDLHDVVAHHVSAIAVQARATEELLADGPPDGRTGAARIADTADTALIEMRRILGLLAAGRDDLAPEPSLAHLDRLIAAAEAAGCRVTARLGGPVAEAGPDQPSAARIPPAIEISAYRIVQEALTNVLKHAGPTHLRIAVRHDPAALTLEVENGPPSPGHRPVPGSGRGLLGIRERVAAFDGTVHAGPEPGGGWRLAVTLPLGKPGVRGVAESPGAPLSTPAPLGTSAPLPSPGRKTPP